MDSVSPELAEPTGLSELIDGIEQAHHAFTRTELERIARMLEQMAAAGHPAPTELVRCIGELHDDLIPHLMKEERILFPYIAELELHPESPPHSCFGSIANPIRMMNLEHANLKSLLVRLRAMTGNYRAAPETASLYTVLEELDADLVKHIYLEDDVLFPRALRLEREMAA